MVTNTDVVFFEQYVKKSINDSPQIGEMKTLQKFISSLILAIAAFSIYSPVTNYGLLWSDKEMLKNSAIFENNLKENLQQVWTNTSDNKYMPLTRLSWAVAHRIDAKNIGPVLHKMSLAFHIGSTLLLFTILSMLFKSAWPPFIGALFFTVHPLQVETVAWVSAFAFAQAAFFGLLAISLYLKFIREKETQSWRAKRFTWWFYYGATAFFFAAMLSSAHAIVVPFIAIVFEQILPRRDSLLAPSRPKWPTMVWLTLSLPLVAAAIILQETSGISETVGIFSRPLIAGDSLAFYFHKILLPLGLTPDYGRSPSFALNQWWIYFSWLTPFTLLVCLAVWKEKARTWYAAGCAIVAVSCLPFWGLVLFESQGMSAVANRYIYLGLAGASVCLAYAVSLRKKPSISLAAIVAIIVFGYMTSKQIPAWQSSKTLSDYSLKINENSPVVHLNLGNNSYKARDFIKASEHYQVVLKINPSIPQVHYRLGEIARSENKLELAIVHYESALKSAPNFVKVYSSLGSAYLAQKKYEKSIAAFDEALKYNTKNAKVFLEIGNAYFHTKKFEQAAKSYRKGLKVAKKNQNKAAILSMLGQSLAETGEVDEALPNLKAALEIDNSLDIAHLALGKIYFSDENLAEAKKHYELASRTIKNDLSIPKNLGKIYLSSKEYSKALGMIDQALELDANSTELLVDQAKATFYTKQYSLAIKRFKSVIEKDANAPDAYYYLGDMSRWGGKIDEALAMYYRAIKYDQYHSPSHYRLGQHFLKNESYSKAIWHFQQALKKDPDDTRIMSYLRKAERKRAG